MGRELDMSGLGKDMDGAREYNLVPEETWGGL